MLCLESNMFPAEGALVTPVTEQAKAAHGRKFDQKHHLYKFGEGVSWISVCDVGVWAGVLSVDYGDKLIMQNCDVAWSEHTSSANPKVLDPVDDHSLRVQNLHWGVKSVFIKSDN